MSENGQKPGWLTSEAWITVVVVLWALVAGINALGLAEDHPVVKAAAFVAAALASLGYGISRALVKKS